MIGQYQRTGLCMHTTLIERLTSDFVGVKNKSLRIGCIFLASAVSTSSGETKLVGVHRFFSNGSTSGQLKLYEKNLLTLD